MAKETLHFKNKHTGKMKQAPVGYSWTMLLFSIFVPILRGDWKWAFIIFVLFSIVIGVVAGVNPTAEHPEGVAPWLSLILGFFYNKTYIKGLIAKGYEVTSAERGEIDVISTKLGLDLPLAK